MQLNGQSQIAKVSLILSIVALLAMASKLAIFIIGMFLPSIFGLTYSLFLLFVSIIGILTSLSGFCLGLAGISQKNRVKKFAFIGTIFSFALLIIYIGVIPILLFL